MRKSTAKTGIPIRRKSAVFPTPLFSPPHPSFSLFPKAVAFTAAVILTQGGAGVSVGLDPNPQEWVLTDGGDFAALGAITRLPAKPLVCFKGRHSKLCWGSQPQLPRTESQTAGLVLLEAFESPG